MAEQSSGVQNKEDEGNDGIGQDKNGASKKKSSLSSVLFQITCAIPLVIVTLFVVRHDLMNMWEMKFGYGTMETYGLPRNIIEKFHEFDTNLDGCLDPEEFAMMDLVSVRQAVSNPTFFYWSPDCTSYFIWSFILYRKVTV